jgi:hypothetical protein
MLVFFFSFSVSFKAFVDAIVTQFLKISWRDRNFNPCLQALAGLHYLLKS